VNVTMTSAHGGIVWWEVTVLGPVDTAAAGEVGAQIEKVLDHVGFFDRPALAAGPAVPASVTVAGTGQTRTVARDDLPPGTAEELEDLLQQAGARWTDRDLRNDNG
jgi:hypothetical protein